MKLKILLCLYVLVGLYFRDPAFAMKAERSDEDSLTRSASISIQTLSPTKPFAYYDLHLSDPEKSILKTINVNSTAEYNNYNSLENLAHGVKEFIVSLGNDEKTATSASHIITRVVKGLIQASKQETAWVAFRSFTPTHKYDMLRGHQDGYFFKPYEGAPYKFALSLKGAPTLFFLLPSETKKRFFALQDEGTKENEYNRQSIATLLKTLTPSTAPSGHGAVFIAGPDYAAVHSEPPIEEARLFLSVLPGSKIQIEEWQRRE